MLLPKYPKLVAISFAFCLSSVAFPWEACAAAVSDADHGVSVWPFASAFPSGPSPEVATTVTKSLQGDFDTASPWTVVVNAPPPNTDPLSSTPPQQPKICFSKSRGGPSDCTGFQDLFTSSLPDQTFTSLSVVPLRSKSPRIQGLILRALGQYPTGHEYETAIWVYDVAKDAFHLAAVMTAGDFSEVRIVNNGPLDGYLIAASWSWAKGEGRWDSHRRLIQIGHFDVAPGSEPYRELMVYTTAKAYGAEDADTIDAEWDSIKTHLTANLGVRPRPIRKAQ